jgi:hypothetical protein
MFNGILKLSSVHTDDLCKNIIESSFIQTSIKKCEKYNDLTDMIIANNDPAHSLLIAAEKVFHLNQKRLELGTEIEERTDLYITQRFNNHLSVKKIQGGLMRSNCISSLYFLSEYYKLKVFLIDDAKSIYYETPREQPSKMYISRVGDMWTSCSFNDSYEKCTLKEIESLEKDLVSYDVYDIPLRPMSTYKLHDIHDIANKIGSDVRMPGATKMKTKKVLYDEIKSYYLNLI